jgi:3-mercaptopyruvate sulfurtransferase SseA
LQELGFTNAYALLGGLTAWQQAQLPIEQAPEEPPVTQPTAPMTPPAGTTNPH